MDETAARPDHQGAREGESRRSTKIYFSKSEVETEGRLIGEHERRAAGNGISPSRGAERGEGWEKKHREGDGGQRHSQFNTATRRVAENEKGHVSCRPRGCNL
eukprot:scaffold200438_cov19-Tisochrysis_lutea.AAC.1